MPGAVARLFDAMAGSYDELEPWYEHLYATLHGILSAELSRPGGGRGLDAGCGTGLQTAVLEALGYDTHGIDLSAGLLAVARSRLRTSSLTLGDVTALPYADASFEAVTCCGSTLSFVETPGAALRELGRVLRPGGRLVLECEHKWSLDLGWAALSSLAGDVLGYGVSAREAWRQLARPLGEGFWLDYPVLLPGGVTATMRIRLFTMGELRAMLRAAGFTPLRAWGIHSATNLIPSTILHRERLGRLAARLFEALAVIDRAIGGLPPGRWLANSVVILASKDLIPRAG